MLEIRMELVCQFSTCDIMRMLKNEFYVGVCMIIIWK